MFFTRPVHSGFVLLTALTVVVPVLLSGCGPDTVGSDATAEQAREHAARESRRRQSDQHTLQSSSMDLDPATRQAAAAELLTQGSPEAMAILSESLTSGKAGQVSAVLTAIDGEIRPNPALLQACLQAMSTVPADNRDALGALLVRYSEDNPGIFDTIRSKALDSKAPLAERESAVACLGEFHSQPAEAARVLVDLLQQPEQIALARSAAISLSRLTGLPSDWATERWLAWWDVNQDRPSNLWLRDAINAQGRRIADLETQLNQARERDRLVVTRLVEVYRDLWPLLEIEQQLDRIPGMLIDDRTGIRSFGVDRVAVLLRDGEGTELIEEAVLERLDDPDVQIRRKVAAILGELSNPGTMERVIDRLQIESDPEVLNHALRIMQVRGDRDQLGLVLPLLRRDDTREVAAATTWAFLRNWTPSESERIELSEVLGSANDTTSTPQETALRVLVIPESQLEEAVTFLDSSDAATRTAVAEALLRRQRYEDILASGSDPAIYPVAVNAALELPTDRPMERIERLLLLSVPSESQQATWQAALSVASESVPASEVPVLDDRLASHEHADETLRITILDKALENEAITETDQIALLKRLVPLLIKNNKAKTAVILLEKLHEQDPDLSAMRFEAALLSRDFDIAAAMSPDMINWIQAYDEIRQSHPESAGALKDEITQRFNDQLDEATRARLGIAVDPLMNDSETTGDLTVEAEDGQRS